MESRIAEGFLTDEDAARARQIIGSCVHCGMCLPTCPTYQLDADERDSPRGRIYLISKMLEAGAPSQVTLRHLDRCLTCRACERACPSGVRYGELANIGRHAAEPARGIASKLLNMLVAEFFAGKYSVKCFALAANLCRPFLRGGLKKHFARRRITTLPSAAKLMQNPPDNPVDESESTTATTNTPLRRVVILQGCVEGALSPQTHAALQTVLAAGGCEVVALPGCCGALRYHLNRQESGMADMRRNVVAMAKLLRSGAADAVVMTASGCHQMLTEYPRILKSEDADYVCRHTLNAAEAVEQLWEKILPKLQKKSQQAVVYHSPCTMQNGLQLSGRAEALLAAAGYKVLHPADSHVCCGSAGAYSMLQRRRAAALRQRKLENMDAAADNDAVYATANIGCQLHLGNGGDKAVLHWLELLAESLTHERSTV